MYTQERDTHPTDKASTTSPSAEMGVSMPPRAPRGPSQRFRILALVALLVLLFVGIGGGAMLVGGTLVLPGQHSSVSSVLGAASAPVRVGAEVADFQQAVIEVVRSVQPSVVEVRSSGAQGREGVGSGNIVTADGYIVTNDHVVRGFTSYTVQLADGKTYPARLIGEAPQDDLAVVKIDATGLPPIAFGGTADVRVGQFVLALGSPLGLQQSVTFGIVSALDRSASEAPNGPAALLAGLIQTSAPINPGNSGGALVNLHGELIGVPTLGAVGAEGQAAGGIGFAIPADRVRFVADQLIREGHVTNSGQGFLGIQGVAVTPQVVSAHALSVERGVLVTGFANAATGESPAQRAGLREGDVITQVGSAVVADNAELMAALLPRAPGSSVDVSVARGGEHIHLTVTLGERPAVAAHG